MGVGEPTFDAVDHVLSKFKPGERAAVDDAIANAAQAALMWIRKGAEAAMNKFNGGDEKPKKKSEAREQKAEGGDQKTEKKS
jgi:PTH1 family peptidyl-tRNA hydrolase